MDNMIFWGSIAALVVILLAVLAFVKLRGVLKDRRNRPSGPEIGADKVVAAARHFAHANDAILIAPAHLAQKGRTATLNALVVGYFGILGVRALGYNGTIYGRGDEDEWVQVAANEQRVYFQNPQKQDADDVRVIRDALFAGKFKTVPVEVVTVFCNKKAELALSRKAEALTMKNYKTMLRKEKYEKDAGVDIKKIEEALRKALVQP